MVAYARLVLASNDGKGRFKVMKILETGIGAMGVSAADYDGDGDLDLYLCHYSRGDLDLDAGATVIGSGGQFVYHDANNAGRNYFYRNDSGGEGWGGHNWRGGTVMLVGIERRQRGNLPEPR